MTQFHYVLLAYGVSSLIFSGMAWLIIQRDRKIRHLLSKLKKDN